MCRGHCGFDTEQNRAESIAVAPFEIIQSSTHWTRGLIADRGFNGTRPRLQLGTVAAHHPQVVSKVHEEK